VSTPERDACVLARLPLYRFRNTAALESIQNRKKMKMNMTTTTKKKKKKRQQNWWCRALHPTHQCQCTPWKKKAHLHLGDTLQ